jgi:hypothetical protein
MSSEKNHNQDLSSVRNPQQDMSSKKKPSKIIKKGRLQPGKMLVADLDENRIIWLITAILSYIILFPCVGA